MATLTIKNLHVELEKKPILNGINLIVRKGQTHIIMGPNGSGKSTLGNTLLAHPATTITKGKVTFGKHVISKMKTDEIARAGVMLALQHPQAVSGVTAFNLLTLAARKFAGDRKSFSPARFREEIKDVAKQLHMEQEFLSRSLNEGFSGGEKKKMEILQLSLLPAECLIIDEIDSGLDIDALKLVAKQIVRLQKRGVSLVIITHYNRILRWITPDRVHILHKGRIVKSGTSALAKDIEKKGYGAYIKN
jgi:Fe-S cluster assembly ATP-binding protein